jgi:hypothetical protein
MRLPCTLGGVSIFEIFSHNGVLSFGVSGDYDTALNEDVLCEGIEHGLDQLVRLAERLPATAGASRARGRPKPAPAR